MATGSGCVPKRQKDQSGKRTADPEHSGGCGAMLLGECRDALACHGGSNLLPKSWHAAAVCVLVKGEGRVVLHVVQHDSSAPRGERLVVRTRCSVGMVTWADHARKDERAQVHAHVHAHVHVCMRM